MSGLLHLKFDSEALPSSPAAKKAGSVAPNIKIGIPTQSSICITSPLWYVSVRTAPATSSGAASHCGKKDLGLLSQTRKTVRAPARKNTTSTHLSKSSLTCGPSSDRHWPEGNSALRIRITALITAGLEDGISSMPFLSSISLSFGHETALSRDSTSSQELLPEKSVISCKK